MNHTDPIVVQQRLNQFLAANGLTQLTWSKAKTERLQAQLKAEFDMNHWPFQIKFFLDIPTPQPGTVSGRSSVELNLFYNSDYNAIPKELLGLCRSAKKIQVKFVSFTARWEMPYGVSANPDSTDL